MLDPDLIRDATQKPISRKEFLRQSGVIILSVLGISSLVGLILQLNPKYKNLMQTKSRRGFGGGKYGA